MEGSMKHIIDVQNSYYSHSLEKLEQRLARIDAATQQHFIFNYKSNDDKRIQKLTRSCCQLSPPFDFEDVLRMQLMGISPYQYIELCTQWIETWMPNERSVYLIRSSFPTQQVSKEFMDCIELKLTSLNYSMKYRETSVPIRTAKLDFDLDFLDPFCYSTCHRDKSKPTELIFESEDNNKYTVAVCFYSTAPLVRVQKVMREPITLFPSDVITVCHIYFRTVSKKGNSSFVSILSDDSDEFEDALRSRKKCYIYIDYFMPEGVAM